MTSPADPERAIRDLDRTRLFDRRPHGQQLGNGRYTALITNAGSGHSECDGIALTRSRADPVEDGDGWFFYLRDLASGDYWSIGYQPTGGEPERYEVQLAPEWALILRQDAGIEATLTVALASGDPLEIRRCGLENRSSRPRRIEITSYLEPVLQASAADAAHPAFSKLFVQTEAAPAQRALLATRRPRGADEPGRWLAHWLIEDGGPGPVPHYETDRQRFIGRGRSLAAPAALATGAALSGTVGNVLDPILCLRTVVELAPGERRTLAFGLGFAATRAAALGLAASHAHLADVAQILGRMPDRAAGTAPTPVSPAPSIGYQPASPAEPARCGHGRGAAEFDNGFGGFARRRPRVRHPRRRRRGAPPPPLPWINVIANESFGFLASARPAPAPPGAATAASTGSRRGPTIRSADPHGEALYLRDEERRGFWSPLPGAGAGRRRLRGPPRLRLQPFRHASHGLEQEVCAVRAAPRTREGRPDPPHATEAAPARRLSLFAYPRLVLGVLPEQTAPVRS